MFGLKSLRSKVGMSQMRLAKETGVSRYRIHLAENGYDQLRQDEKKKILAAFSKIAKKSGVTRG